MHTLSSKKSSATLLYRNSKRRRYALSPHIFFIFDIRSERKTEQIFFPIGKSWNYNTQASASMITIRELCLFFLKGQLWLRCIVDFAYLIIVSTNEKLVWLFLVSLWAGSKSMALRQHHVIKSISVARFQFWRRSFYAGTRLQGFGIKIIICLFSWPPTFPAIWSLFPKIWQRW